MRTNAIRRLGAVLCLFGVILWLTAGVLLHTTAADVKGTLTILSQTEEGVKLAGMQWDIYKIGGRDAEGKYELQGAFEKYPVSLEDTSTSALTFAAETLNTFATVYKEKPLDSKKADENGALKFEDLGVGLYLVSGDYVQIDDTYYFPAPFLMEVTEFGGENQVYDMVAFPKYIYMNAEEKSEYTVKKVWANDELHTFTRTPYVTVEIYCDDLLYQTVRLDESNDWTYSWSSDKPYDWKVLEVDIPKDYFVVFRNNEKQYVVVNSFNTASSIEDSTQWTDSVVTETVESTEKSTDETIATSETVKATENTSTSITTSTTIITTTTTTPEKLPQTGQLWWPVPVLALAGLVLMGIGFKLRTKE
ncbi:MAG: Cna B-type domain-containing protein [Ruminococcus sp.]|nr:Cna B-type domain-containing protein [Ruminococcus sp.]